MKTEILHRGRLLRTAFLILLFPFVFTLQNCNEESESLISEISSEELESRKRKNPPPPPPPPPFYFSNCSEPDIQGSFVVGEPTNAKITLNYINSPGGPHNGFTSNTVNGITLTAPAGTLNVGSGSIVYTASGTPVSAGVFTITVSIGTSYACPLNISVVNPPPSGPTVDPGPEAGSTGVINFTYKGQSVAYRTVRAKDGKIWLQQNLGASQVAIHTVDQSSYGDYFQFGRWDDGHQTYNSPTITGGASLMNPSHISSGYPNFIKGTTAGTRWWSIGGTATDTWSGSIATSTNGKDPCAVLGPGWRLPTAAEWQHVSILEDLFGAMAAWDSNLRLPAAGYRLSYDGFVYRNGNNGHYWTSTAADNSNARVFVYDDDTYNARIELTQRGEGFPCRCLKN
jgi:hypothetical protein